MILLLLLIVGAMGDQMRIHRSPTAREIVRFAEGGLEEPLRSLLLYTPPFDGHVATQALFIVAFYHQATMPGAPPICEALSKAAKDTLNHMRAFEFPYATLPDNVATPMDCTLRGPLNGDPLRILRDASRLVTMTIRELSS